MESNTEQADKEVEPTVGKASGYGTRTPSGNARVFKCKQCNRAFTREEHLTRHTLLTHNKLRPFVCGICWRPFSRRDLLLRHAKNLHEGSELAVSRIRKLCKRKDDSGHRSSGESTSPSETLAPELGPPGRKGSDGERLSRSSSISDEPSNNGVTVSPVSRVPSPESKSQNTHTSTPRLLDKSVSIRDDYDSPELKRLKMSVNMLIS